jgi:hypothetical protein
LTLLTIGLKSVIAGSNSCTVTLMPFAVNAAETSLDRSVVACLVDETMETDFTFMSVSRPTIAFE